MGLFESGSDTSVDSACGSYKSERRVEDTNSENSDIALTQFHNMRLVDLMALTPIQKTDPTRSNPKKPLRFGSEGRLSIV